MVIFLNHLKIDYRPIAYRIQDGAAPTNQCLQFVQLNGGHRTSDIKSDVDICKSRADSIVCVHKAPHVELSGNAQCYVIAWNFQECRPSATGDSHAGGKGRQHHLRRVWPPPASTELHWLVDLNLMNCEPCRA